LENVNWEDIKANGKTELDLRDIAYDTDKLITAAVKCHHLPQNLQLCLYCFANALPVLCPAFYFKTRVMSLTGKEIRRQFVQWAVF
jgi:hypothetical protein